MQDPTCPWIPGLIETGGLNIEGEGDSYDFGTGAGFYVNATKAPYDKGYNMYSYVTEELPQVVFSAFPQLDSSRISITGHSMGGHGALTLVRTTFCAIVILRLTDIPSFSKTRENTSPYPLLHPYPTQ